VRRLRTDPDEGTSLPIPGSTRSHPPQFGKQIQAQQVPGWSSYYLDYKFLKKIISSLAANRPASEAAALASGIRPSDFLNSPRRPPIFTASDHDDDRGSDFHAHKAAFFFKLERELEKVKRPEAPIPSPEYILFFPRSMPSTSARKPSSE